MATFVPGFLKDVFISYARVAEEGWVPGFVEKLQTFLDQELAADGAAKIFFDRSSLNDDDPLSEEITLNVTSTATFVIVLSKAYLQDESRQRNDAATFVDVLLGAIMEADAPLYVVLTMRSDFLGNCDTFLGLPEAISRNQYLTPRLSRTQQEEVIRGPLRLFHAEIDDALVTKILNDTGTDADKLPLMEHALLRTWQIARQRAGGALPHLTLADYAQAGGAQVALSKHADEAFDKLRHNADRGMERARVAEQVFRSLACYADDGQLVRRPLRRGTLLSILSDAPDERVGDDLDAVIAVFRGEDRHFLTQAGQKGTDESVIDVSHESLLRQLVMLRDQWLPDELEAARQYRHYLDEAREWSATAFAPDSTRRETARDRLLSRSRLVDAMAWWNARRPTRGWMTRHLTGADGNHQGSSQAEHVSLLPRFLAASREAEEERQAAQDRNQRRWTRLKWTLAFLTIVAAEFGGWARYVTFQEEAARRDVARLAAESCLLNGGNSIRYERDMGAGVLWYMQAMEVAGDAAPLTRINARSLTESWWGVLPTAVLRHEGRVLTVAFSPDGTRVLTGSADNTARLWQVPPPAGDDPALLRISVEVLIGRAIENGLVCTLTRDEWNNRQRQLDELGGPYAGRELSDLSDTERAQLRMPYNLWLAN